jgi:7-cyano-7-deazaguanine synthase
MAQIIFLSGGMDSFLSYRLFHRSFVPVFVNTGSRYAHMDLGMAREQAGRRLLVLDAPVLRERPDGVVPHRNALLLAYAANRLNAETICVSAPRGELIWDQQPAFYRSMEHVLRGVRIVNPLGNFTKAQAVADYIRAAPATAQYDLAHTRSCYSATEWRCGQCPACVKRYVAMKTNGITEQYTHDVRAYARTLLQKASPSDVLRYGVRPVLEAWRALR